MITKTKDEIPINCWFLILFTPSIALYHISHAIIKYSNQTVIKWFDLIELYVFLQPGTNQINSSKLRSCYTNKNIKKIQHEIALSDII